jgi:lamin tail-like protein
VRRVILIVAALAVLSVSFASSVQAASPIQIRKVYYNSPGTDTRSNASLNGEYVLLKNVTSTRKTLTGWTVRDGQSHVYKFGTFTVPGYGYVYLHTGIGTNSTTRRYWRQSAYIWNNTSDRATLKNASGTTMDTCAYSSSSRSYITC